MKKQSKCKHSQRWVSVGLCAPSAWMHGTGVPPAATAHPRGAAAGRAVAKMTRPSTLHEATASPAQTSFRAKETASQNKAWQPKQAGPGECWGPLEGPVSTASKPLRNKPGVSTRPRRACRIGKGSDVRLRR